MTDTPNQTATRGLTRKEQKIMDAALQRQTRAKDGDAIVRHLMDNGGWLFLWPLWTIREIGRTRGLGGAIMKLALVMVLGLACWEAMNAFGEVWNASLVR